MSSTKILKRDQSRSRPGVPLLAALLVTGLFGCKEGVRGGSVQDVFTGVNSVKATSPTSVQIKWTTNYRYQSYEVYGNYSSEPLVSRIFDNAEIANLTPNQGYAFTVVAINGAERSGFDREIQIAMPPRFAGISAVAPNEDGDLVATWDYNYDFADFSVYYVPWVNPTSANTSTWTDVKVLTTEQQVLFQNLAGSTRYHFTVHAKYGDGTWERPNVFAQGSTSSSFPNPSDLVTIPSRVIGSLPFVTVKPQIDAQFQAQYYTSQAFWNGSPVTDPLTGLGTMVFSSSAGLTRGKVDDISVQVTYNDQSTINETLLVDGLSTYIKGQSEDLDVPPVENLGTGEAFYASSMASGDFNCDGYADLAVGAPHVSVGSVGVRTADAGAVVIYYSAGGSGPKLSQNTGGTPTNEPQDADDGPLEPQVLTFDDLPVNAEFGFALASGGNLNGDAQSGIACQDLIVGAPGMSSSGKLAWNGTAFVFFGSRNGLTAPAHLSDFPANVETCDGLATDASCSAVRFWADYPNWPKGGVSPLPASGYSATQYASLGDMFGYSVSFIGDFNADGYDDMVIGSPNADWDGQPMGMGSGAVLSTNILANTGAVSIFFGSKYGLGRESPNYTGSGIPQPGTDAMFRFLKVYAPQPQAGAQFGVSVAGGADVDGWPRVYSGLPGVHYGGSDFVVGAPGFVYTNPFDNAYLDIGPSGPDFAASIPFTSNGGWHRTAKTEPGATWASQGTADFFNIAASTGIAYVYYGRSFTNPNLGPTGGQIEVPSRNAFWNCGRRGMNSAQYHYSCLVDENNIGILTPRAPASYFGSAVAMAGRPSYFNSNGSAPPVTAFTDPNADGFAEIFVAAGGGTGQIWQYFGNRARIFNPWQWAQVVGVQAEEFRLNDPHCEGFHPFPGSGYTQGQGFPAGFSAQLRKNCAPTQILPNSVAAAAAADANAAAGMGAGNNTLAAGDITGDGTMDLVVGAPYDATEGYRAGAVYAFTSVPTQYNGGGASIAVPGLGLSTNLKKFISNSGDTEDRLGMAVAIGNFDRDLTSGGLPLNDVAAGAPYDDTSRPAAGEAHLFLSSGLALPAIKYDSDVKIYDVLATPQSYGYYRARIIGDVNGDGYDDAFARVRRFDGAGNVVLDAVIYFGSDEGLITSTLCAKHPEKVFLDGMQSITECYPKVSHVSGLTRDGISLPQLITKPNNQGNGWSSYASAIGDVNGDGFGDILFWDGGVGLLAYYGSANGIQAVTNPAWFPATNDPQIISQVIVPHFNSAILGQTTEWTESWPFEHGDFNGDGYADLVISDPGFNKNPPSGWVCDDTSAVGTIVDSQCEAGRGMSNFGAVYVLYGAAFGLQTPSTRGFLGVDFAVGGPEAGQLVDIYGLEDSAGTSLSPNTPCTGPVDGKLCKASFIENPVLEKIGYGWLKLSSSFGSTVTAINLGGPSNPYDSLLIGAPSYTDPDCYDPYSNEGIVNKYRDFGRIFVYHGREEGIQAAPRNFYYPYRNAPFDGSDNPLMNNVGATQSPGHVEDMNNVALGCGESELDPSLGTAGSLNTTDPLRAIQPPFSGSIGWISRAFGARVTVVGDINNDGYEDLAVSTPSVGVPGVNKSGVTYIYYGPICGWDNELAVQQGVDAALNQQIDAAHPQWSTINSPPKSTRCNSATSGALKPAMQKFYVKDALDSSLYGWTMLGGRKGKSDVNGDGFDDLLVATPFYDDPLTSRVAIGRGVVYFGSNKGLFTNDYPNVTVVKNAQGLFNPFSMVPRYEGDGTNFFYINLSQGDVNNDGTVDYMIPSPWHDGVEPVKGVDLGVFFMFY